MLTLKEKSCVTTGAVSLPNKVVLRFVRGSVTHYCLIETVRSESFESIAGRLQRAGTAGM